MQVDFYRSAFNICYFPLWEQRTLNSIMAESAVSIVLRSVNGNFLSTNFASNLLTVILQHHGDSHYSRWTQCDEQKQIIEGIFGTIQ